MSKLDDFNIDNLRSEIDKIDSSLVSLFEKRMEVVLKVAEYKKNNHMEVLNKAREEIVIKKNLDLVKNKNLFLEVEEFFKSVMEISRGFQNKNLNREGAFATEKKLTVGFYGVTGSFSEQALKGYFGENVDAKAISEFEDIFLQLKYGKINYGVIPIENSSTGAISAVYDLLNKYNFYITGEKYLKISQNLMGIRGSTLDDIKEVYSHPQGLEQSMEFLKGYNQWKLVPYNSTAKSAQLVKDRQDKTLAAIASAKAAEIYNLEILQKNVNSNATNMTRFVVIGKELESTSGNNKTSLVLSTTHKAGSLYHVLKHFEENGINLLKIESRPIKDKPWEYFFYIDFHGNIDEDKIISSIKLIKKNSRYFKILGNYKSEMIDNE
ncbi:prephenate dehydratase [Clostridium sp. CM028]|uniref:prephenate dehydratase n=1 Tax=Clostridium sp. CM028 TaxID=2851575 RepID=UPI001C6F40A3|nr:prephenate dehydratase [Clostridium sp. CM028]MBW9150448.1 prephenate dehydratase [Clostridium sp. CM028]WLC62424.1 prephenate dehydratase [Clostridium sp. CM028]